MKKRFIMRIASLAAVCAIFTGTVSMPAIKIHADTITSAEAKSGLKDALAAAKRISVPEHLTEFGYTAHKAYSTICYVFTWTTPSNAEKYEECRANLPEDAAELIIEGGNHAYFGSYGLQDGDGTATITNDIQIADAVEFTMENIR